MKTSPPAGPRPVVIDTDPGVDDALALMLALRSPEISVELITTVAGNVPVDIATSNARRLLALIGPTRVPPLARGSARPLRRALHTAQEVHGNDGLGGLSHITDVGGEPLAPATGPVAQRNGVARLIEQADRHAGALTVIALGPLTNIAHAVRRAPKTMRKIDRLVVMGGAIDEPGNVTPTAEFNIYVDPDAAREVVGSGLRITLVPLDVTRQVRLTQAYLREHLGTSRSVMARAIRHLTRDLLVDTYRNEGFPLHDPLAVAVAMDASLVRTESLRLGIETEGRESLGQTIVDRRTVAKRPFIAPEVEIATGVDAKRVLDLLAARVLVPDRAPSKSTSARKRSSGPTADAPAHAQASVHPARVAVVGSANIDYIVSARRLPQPGETVHGDPLLTAHGGKGANQAVAAARAGAAVSFVAMLGDDDAGHRYLDALRREGLDVGGVGRAKGPSGVALIAVDQRGQNLITVAPGANEALAPAHIDAAHALLGAAAVLVTQLETPLPSVERALRVARRQGVMTLLNPAPARTLPKRFAALVDVLVVNQPEAALLAGMPASSIRGAERAARRLGTLGYLRVLVTLGRQGVVWSDHGHLHRLAGRAVSAVDATGAGDTFVGYLACALAEGQSLAKGIALANTAAAVSVTRRGAQPAIPHRIEVSRAARRRARRSP